jgi:hypothetical protein
MSFAARNRGGPLVVEFTITPGFDAGGSTTGYQSGRSGTAIGSITPDAANIFGGRLNGLVRFPNASFNVVHLDTEAFIPIEYERADIYVAGVFWVTVVLFTSNRFRTLVSTSVFTVGVPVAVRVEFFK